MINNIMKKFSIFFLVILLTSIFSIQYSASAEPVDNPPPVECAALCNYALVDPHGNVLGGAVCDNHCTGQTVYAPYPACATGQCTLVVQYPQDSSGNVVGAAGPGITYNPATQVFTNPAYGEHRSGDPHPVVSHPPAPSTIPEETIPETPANDTPSTTIPDSQTTVPTTTIPSNDTTSSIQSYSSKSTTYSSKSKSSKTKKSLKIKTRPRATFRLY